MNLDIDKLATDIIGAMKKVLEERWPEVGDYAETEAKKLAQSLVSIEMMKLNGHINEQEAKRFLQMHRNATSTVFLAIEGLGILAAEEAINAALGVVKDTVNTAMGFSLL